MPESKQLFSSDTFPNWSSIWFNCITTSTIQLPCNKHNSIAMQQIHINCTATNTIQLRCNIYISTALQQIEFKLFSLGFSPPASPPLQAWSRHESLQKRAWSAKHNCWSKINMLKLIWFKATIATWQIWVDHLGFKAQNGFRFRAILDKSDGFTSDSEPVAAAGSAKLQGTTWKQASWKSPQQTRMAKYRVNQALVRLCANNP